MTDGNAVERRKVEPDIDRLVERARHGDGAAFSRLVDLHQSEVYTLAVRLVGNRALAADVAQEAMIRAWRALPRFRGDAAFGTWLHRITVNTAWTHRSRAQRHLAASIDEVGERADPVLAHDPQLHGERIELRARLADALDQLSPAHRTVVILKDVFGWSHREIGDSLSISIAAAKVRLHRAHQRLREFLRESS